MDNDAIPLEELWDALLSRNSKVIEKAFNTLTPPDQAAVLAHLIRMVNEPGWQPGQRASARAALKEIDKNQDKEK